MAQMFIDLLTSVQEKKKKNLKNLNYTYFQVLVFNIPRGGWWRGDVHVSSGVREARRDGGAGRGEERWGVAARHSLGDALG